MAKLPAETSETTADEFREFYTRIAKKTQGKNREGEEKGINNPVITNRPYKVL